MTERNPELTPSQYAIKELTDAMLAHSAIRYSIPNTARPVEVAEQLRRLGIPDLLLTRGDSTSHPDPLEYYPERGLYIGAKTLMRGIGQTGLHVSRWDRKEVWERKLDVSLSYTNGSQEAVQTISAYVSSIQPGVPPKISRGMSMPPNGFEDTSGEHSQQVFIVDDETVVAFAAICRSIFARVDSKRLVA